MISRPHKRRVVHWYEQTKRFLGNHFLATLGAIIGVWALWYVPQVTNLWKQLPPAHTSMWRLFALNTLYVVALTWFYIPSWFVVVAGTLDAQHPAVWPFSRFALFRALWGYLAAPAEQCSRWLPTLAMRFVARRMMWVLLVALAAMTTLVWIFGSHPHGSRLYPLGGALCLASGGIMAMVGVWLIPAAINKTVGPKWIAWGRFLSWWISAILVGEALWAASAWQVNQASFRIYTIWALFHLFSSLVIFASLLDFYDARTTLPIRLIAPAAVIWMIWQQGPETIHDLSFPHLHASPAANQQHSGPLSHNDWYDYALARLNAIPAGPVVIVAASGGGSRASIFTALVLEELSHQPMVLNESTEATPPKPSESKTWADHIFLISSVSGGSLAAADFVAGATTSTTGKLHNIDNAELLLLMREHLLSILDKNPDADVKPGLDRALRELRMIEKDKDSSCGWLLRSRFLDDMTTDFMAPIMRSLFTPVLTRGDGLAHFWNDTFQWKYARLSDWSLKSPRFGPAKVPLLVVNACDTDRGARLAIGFPALPRELLRDPTDPAVEGRTVRAPGEPISLSDLEGNETCDIALHRAVRLSSNFPWGFPVARLNKHSNPPLASTINVLDGGVVDNTGLDTVYYLFRGMQNARNSKGQLNEKAKQLLQKLRSRGIVLIEIDSGARPINERQLFEGVNKPLEALNNAVYSNASQSKESYLQKFKDVLRPLELDSSAKGSDEMEQRKWQVVLSGLQSTTDPLVFKYRFGCNHIDDMRGEVMTAWALGPKDVAVVFGQFLTSIDDWEMYRRRFPQQYNGVRMARQDSARAAYWSLLEYRMLTLQTRMSAVDKILRELAASGTSPATPEQLVAKRAEVDSMLRAEQADIASADQLVVKLQARDDFGSKLDRFRRRLDDRQRLVATTDLKPEELERAMAASPSSMTASLASDVSDAATRELRSRSRSTLKATRTAMDIQRTMDQRDIKTQHFYQRLQKE